MNIKKVTALGIGIALFVVSSYLFIPTFVPNVTLQPRVAILALFSVLFGPIVGGLMGLIGHALADSLQYGSIWWSWVFASSSLGVFVGLLSLKYNFEDVKFTTKHILVFNILQVVANTITWLLIAPTLDVVIYKEPVEKVYLQGITATIINVVTVGIITTVLLIVYSSRNLAGKELKKED